MCADPSQYDERHVGHRAAPGAEDTSGYWTCDGVADLMPLMSSDWADCSTAAVDSTDSEGYEQK